MHVLSRGLVGKLRAEFGELESEIWRGWPWCQDENHCLLPLFLFVCIARGTIKSQDPVTTEKSLDRSSREYCAG